MTGSVLSGEVDAVLRIYRDVQATRSTDHGRKPADMTTNGPSDRTHAEVGIRQWTVQTPHGARRVVFEDPGKAWDHASRTAGADAPSVVRDPDGRAYLVLRHDSLYEVSTRHQLVGTTRRVVDL